MLPDETQVNEGPDSPENIGPPPPLGRAPIRFNSISERY
jgi:hypothetical protein